MKRFLIAFLAAFIIVGAIVAVGVSLRPGDRSTGFFDWFDNLDSDGIHLGDGENGSGSLVPVDLNESAKWDQEKEIRVKSEVSDVIFVQGDSDQIEVKTTGKVTESIEVYLEIEKRTNSIQIHLWQEQPKILMTNTTNLDTVITLPKDFAGELNVVTNVGDLDLGEFAGESVIVDSDVGEVMGTVEADEIEIESNVGDIDVTVAGGDIALKSDVGEITFDCAQADSIVAETDVGAIHANLSKAVVDLGIAADSGVGDVNASVSFEEGKDSGAAVQLYAGVGEVKIKEK